MAEEEKVRQLSHRECQLPLAADQTVGVSRVIQSSLTAELETMGQHMDKQFKLRDGKIK